MTSVLFVDVESSDLVKPNRPLDDPSQPWAVSIAALLVIGGAEADHFHVRIKAEGRQVRAGAEAVHGISSRDAAKRGVSETAALGMLCGLAAQSEIVVGHGIDFDRQVVEGCIRRLKKPATLWVRPGLEFVDTMKAATPFCRLKADREDGSFKWPSLDEACSILLGEAPREGVHSAWEDLGRTRRLFDWLAAHGAFEVAA
jgi:DNA polymerase III epsilon subunit-like protein